MEKLIAEKIFKSTTDQYFIIYFLILILSSRKMLFFVYFFFFFEEESRVSDSFRGETQLNRVLQLSSRTEGEKKLKKPRRAPVRKSREGLIGIRLDKFIGDSLSRFLSFKSIWK